MGARKMGYNDLKPDSDSRLDAALSMGASQPAAHSTNRQNMPPDDVRIDDDFAQLFTTDPALIDDIAQSFDFDGGTAPEPQ